MKKNILLLTFLLISTQAFVSCAGNENNSSTSETSSSISSSETSFNASDFSKSIKEMKMLLENTSFDLEAENTKSATRSTTIVEQQMYAIKTKTTTETLSVYEAPYAIINGVENITYKSTDSILGDDYEGFAPKTDSYISFRGVYENQYHEVVDYEDGKDRDTAAKYDIGSDIKEEELNFQASMQSSYFVYYYLENVFEASYGESFTLTPTLDNDNLTYTVEFDTNIEDEYGFINYYVSLSFDISIDGFVNGYTYLYDEKAQDYDENGILGEEYVLYSISDNVQITRGEKQANLTTLPIVPSDYWLQSFDIQIIATDYLDVELPCEPDAVSCGFYIEARAINIYPEKALDTTLTIVSSTNQDVVNINQYGMVTSLKEGSTDLKVVSESGLEKTISISTFEESINELEIKIFATHLFVGETYGVYEFYYPENAIDELNWESSNESIATITVDENNYASINCISVGTVTIKATSVKIPNVSATVTVKITEKLNEDALKSLVTSSPWYNVETPEDIITFYEDGTGNVTFKDFFTEEVGTYDFEWFFAEYDETQGLLISITTMIGDYNFSVCILSLNGEIMEVYFQMADPEMWFFQYAGDFAQNLN